MSVTAAASAQAGTAAAGASATAQASAGSAGASATAQAGDFAGSFAAALPSRQLRQSLVPDVCADLHPPGRWDCKQWKVGGACWAAAFLLLHGLAQLYCRLMPAFLLAAGCWRVRRTVDAPRRVVQRHVWPLPPAARQQKAPSVATLTTPGRKAPSAHLQLGWVMLLAVETVE